MPLPVRIGLRTVGRRFLKEYPYQEAFFLDKRETGGRRRCGRPGVLESNQIDLCSFSQTTALCVRVTDSSPGKLGILPVDLGSPAQALDPPPGVACIIEFSVHWRSATAAM
jgi:hypothetical protein